MTASPDRAGLLRERFDHWYLDADDPKNDTSWINGWNECLDTVRAALVAPDLRPTDVDADYRALPDPILAATGDSGLNVELLRDATERSGWFCDDGEHRTAHHDGHDCYCEKVAEVVAAQYNRAAARSLRWRRGAALPDVARLSSKEAGE